MKNMTAEQPCLEMLYSPGSTVNITLKIINSKLIKHITTKVAKNLANPETQTTYVDIAHDGTVG